MSRQRPYRAVICDMDGVLTRSAALHQRALQDTLDEYLRTTKKALGIDDRRPLGDDELRAHAQGKTCYQAVADVLASRGVDLPWGAASDPPERETICGLGNRKDQRFDALLEGDGLEVHQDAVAALARWARGGLRCAVVSGSGQAHRVLQAAGLHALADVVIEGRRAGLRTKKALLCRAAEALEVDPSDAVVLEDCTAGIRAGREADFGLVTGVDRNGHRRDLEEAGAHEVVRNVFALRFARRLPSALEERRSIAQWRGSRSLAVFLDYDGTLSPIVDDPAHAVLAPPMRAAIEALAERWPVAIISGRDRPDLEGRMNVPDLLYAGSHGLDIAGRGYARVEDEAEAALPEVDRVHAELRRTVGSVEGVILERKRFSLAIHVRQVSDPEHVRAVERSVDCVLGETTRLRKRLGKKVMELEPAVDWDKGRAMRWMMDVLQLDPRRSFVVYVGDDETDEDAFAALAGMGVGIRVGEPVCTSLADYHVRDSGEVQQLLRWLHGLGRASPDADDGSEPLQVA